MTNSTTSFTGSFPALNSLGLGREHLVALSQQGSIGAEDAGRRYYKLRFNFQGKRLSRYVGCEAGFVEQVRKEVAKLQCDLIARKKFRCLERQAKSCLKEIKSCLEPELAKSGHYYHGHEIRKKRESVNNCSEPSQSRKLEQRSMFMEDPQKTQIDVSLKRPQPQDSAAAVAERRRQVVKNLIESGLDLDNDRQSVFRHATARLLSLSMSVAEQVEGELDENKMTLRELKKYAHPLLNSIGVLAKQATRCAQLDRDFDLTTEERNKRMASLMSEPKIRKFVT